MAWRNALELYLRMAEKDPADLHARQRVAECYVKLNDPVAAEIWYKPLLNELGVSPSVKYEYAEVLCRSSRYNEAKKWYEEYQAAVPNDPLPKDKIEFLNNLNYYLKDSLLMKVIPINLNSTHSDFGPQYFKGGLVFVSSRDLELFIKRTSLASQHEEESLLDLYYSKKNTITGDFGEVGLFGGGNTKSMYHDGPIAFYDHYKKAAFTRNNTRHGKSAFDSSGRRNLHIYFAEVEHSGTLRKIRPFIYNNDSSSTAHASFSEDGKIMFFSSDRPKGYGGADIYFCTNQKGEWSKPVNAGPAINTAGDEFYPFIANDSTLYFTSNGRGGFGGLDIFVSNKRKGKFHKAFNLGYPLNTSFDDFSMITDSVGRTGYFASNRKGGVGLDDIYLFVSDHYYIVGQTKEFGNLSKIIPDVSVYVVDEKGVIVDSTRSDADGYVRFRLPHDENFSFTVKKEGYDILEDVGFSTMGHHYGIDSLAFPLWKRELFAKGKIYSNESHEHIQGSFVLLKNITDHTVDSVYSDNGEYSFLVRPNKKYRVEVHKEGFIPDGFNLNTKDLYKGELLNDIVLEEVYIKKEVAKFSYNKFDVPPESFPYLNQIIRTLKKFPDATLSINAYADSRGTKQYNQLLSDKRAEATKKYILQRGIASGRITARGFGEELILNRCSDGVECSEEEHSKNRRVELKVQQPQHPLE